LAEIERLQRMAARPHGVPWVGVKRPPQQYPHTYPLADGNRRVFPNRTYIETGRGWRVTDKPISRRKRRILARLETAP
jgi:hypothetical protein